METGKEVLGIVINTRDNIIMIKSKVMESLLGQMEMFTKEIMLQI